MTAGLYIHIPFCPQICGYCDFYKVAHRGETQVQSYLESVKREIAFYSDDPRIHNLTFETLYFGGGTPSLLSAAEIHKLLDLIFTRFHFAGNPEVTVETDPGTVDLPKLQAFRAAGVNRLSLGIQSFQNNELAFLDRTHHSDEAIAAFEMARRTGFENISIDLMFGLPGQSLSDWGKNLQRAVKLAPEHISSYCLTFEPGTPLMNKLRKGLVQKPLDALPRAMYLHAIDFLAGCGFEHYEVSNFAKAGFRSRHNLKYWNGSPYLGVGASAHSFVEKRRFWNVRHLKKYHDALAAGRFPIAGEERLTPEKERCERFFLALRQRGGLHVKTFAEEQRLLFFENYGAALSKFFDGDFHDEAFTKDLISGARTLKSDWLEFHGGHLRLTDEGFAVCDSICAEFLK
jgi:oxygen-independent coproporphyrinogen-3 oxidase